jgi:hypothetical protein
MIQDRLGQPGPVKQVRQEQTSSRVASSRRPGWLDAVGKTVGAHPKVAIAAGLGLGVTLGWLIKRR